MLGGGGWGGGGGCFFGGVDAFGTGIGGIHCYASATKHLGIGMLVCRSVSTQLLKKFGRHCVWSILYRLCTLVRALAQ